jgi:hypothetical protein
MAYDDKERRPDPRHPLDTAIGQRGDHYQAGGIPTSLQPCNVAPR